MIVTARNYAMNVSVVYLHRDKLHPWTPDDPLTRELSLLVEYRRRLVDEKTRLTTRLQALLKQYFPQVLDWAGELDPLQALEFLTRWPQLEAIQVATPEFLKSHFFRSRDTSTPGFLTRSRQSRQFFPVNFSLNTFCAVSPFFSLSLAAIIFCSSSVS